MSGINEKKSLPQADVLTERKPGGHLDIRRLTLRTKLLPAVLVMMTALSLLSMAGCGSGGGNDAQTPSPASTTSASTSTTSQNISNPARSYLSITESEYHFSVTPDFFYSTDNQSFWSIQANVATSPTDSTTRNIIRIDIPKTAALLPQLNRAFSIESGGEFEKFPGTFNVLDGRQSSAKKVESGTIVFSPDSVMSESVSGSFKVILTDYDSPLLPAPKYLLKGLFSFTMGWYGPAT